MNNKSALITKKYIILIWLILQNLIALRLVIGAKHIMSCTKLCLAHSHMELGIRDLIKPDAIENWFNFPSKQRRHVMITGKQSDASFCMI